MTCCLFTAGGISRGAGTGGGSPAASNGAAKPTQARWFLFLGGGRLLQHILCCKGRSLQHQAETLQLISWVMSHSQAAFRWLGGFEKLMFLYKLGSFGLQRAVLHAFPCPLEGRLWAGLRHKDSILSPLLECGKDALWACMYLYMCTCVHIYVRTQCDSPAAPQSMHQGVGVYPVLKIASIWGERKKGKDILNFQAFLSIYLPRSLQILVLNP